jgi:DNA-directed RNA polymerase subunit RPC12/RpoP
MVEIYMGDIMLVCVDCELRYEIIWNNDGMETPDRYCPRCGYRHVPVYDSEESDRLNDEA